MIDHLFFRPRRFFEVFNGGRCPKRSGKLLLLGAKSYALEVKDNLVDALSSRKLL